MSDLELNRRGLIGAGLIGATMVGLAACNGKATLAPGVSKADFAGAIKAMRGVVGDEWVWGDADAVRPWSKTYIPDPDGQHVPVGAVAPQTVEEVQEIVPDREYISPTDLAGLHRQEYGIWHGSARDARPDCP